ncbi:MAG: MFS transporter [Verrucomicrobiota bacterium]
MIKVLRWLFNAEVPFSPSKSPCFYGWVIMVAAMMGMILSIPGQTMGVGPFKEELMFNLSLNSQQLSWAYFFGTCASGLTLPWVGTKIDQYGVRPSMVAAGILFAFTLLICSQLELILGTIAYFLNYNYRTWISWALITLCFFAIRFLGQGVLTICCRTMLSRWFDLRRGLVYGLGLAISTLGFGMAPWLLTQLIRKEGWLGAYFALACFVLLGTVLIAWAFFRETPESCGLRMDGLSEKETVHLRAKLNHDDLKMVRDLTRSEAMATYSFWVFNLSLGFWGLYHTGFTFHMISVGNQLGLEEGRIAELFIPIAIVSVLANLTFGQWADKLRMKRILVVMILSCMLGNAGLLTIPHHQLIGEVVLVLGLGISGGLFGVVAGVVWARFFGRKHLGAINGVFMLTTVIGSALGPLLFAEYERWLGSYQGVYITATLILLLLAVSSLWADNPQRKWHTGD